MLTYESDDNFRAMAQAAVQCETATSFPAAVTLAFWAVESNWGKSLTGDFNYWGITRLPEEGPAKMCPTHEDITFAELMGFDARERATAVQGEALGGGRYRYAMQRYFACYASLEESVTAFVGFFTQSPRRYMDAWRQYRGDGDADALVRGICEAGYATDSASVQLRLTLEHQSNIVQAVQLARQEVSDPA